MPSRNPPMSHFRRPNANVALLVVAFRRDGGSIAPLCLEVRLVRLKWRFNRPSPGFTSAWCGPCESGLPAARFGGVSTSLVITGGRSACAA